MARLLQLIVVFAVVAGCSSTATPSAAIDVPPAEPIGIQNLHQVGEGLWSGSAPEGDEGFQTLHDLGVMTIISVDGTKPDVERARRFDLRYVHLPVGYGGITRDRQLTLAR